MARPNAGWPASNVESDDPLDWDAELIEAEPGARAQPETREPSPTDTNFDSAIITASEAGDPAMLAKLDAVCGRVLRN